ncbi:MAG TPA: hypothetical protein VKG84_08725 [Candidatus Acidoferrales bacterium]|nr:hypothetical protein [Candidatus Acidoferrales bacterium]
MKRNHRGFGAVQAVWLLAGVLVIVAAAVFLIHIRGRMNQATVEFPTPYQAVLLTNGSAYFGQLQGYGGPHPVLRDVYYIVSQTNPQTKEVTPVLVKRGKELHEPDRMYLNPSQILFVETVGANSKVAQLIEQAKK